MMEMYLQKTWKKFTFFVGVLRVADEKSRILKSEVRDLLKPVYVPKCHGSGTMQNRHFAMKLYLLTIDNQLP
jgi:hypothetical protein